MKTSNALWLLLTTLFAGCVTPVTDGGSGVNTDRIYAISKFAAYGGASAALIVKPENREALLRARDGVAVLVEQEKWDLLALHAALVAGGLENLHSSEAMIVLQGGLLLTDLFTNKPLDLSQVASAKAAITGIHDGLKLALGPTPRGGRTATYDKLRAEAEGTR